MNYRINGFEQIKALYSIVFSQKYDFTPHHISLYVFFINQNNRNEWVEWFKCPYDLAMAGACIGNKKTYYKCLNDLQKWGLLDYQKGVNEWKSPKIKLEVLKSTSTVPQSAPLLQPLPTTLPEPLPTTLVGINKDNLKPKTLNLKHKTGIINLIYSLYPSNCPKRKSSTGKCSKNKTKIEQLLKDRSKDELEKIINNYIEDCKKSGTYLKNFGTFLNQLPEIEIIPEIIKELQITFRRQGCLDIKVPLSNWPQTKKMYGQQIIWSNEIEILGKEI